MGESKICIVGAGAIGLDLAWNLIHAGQQVTLIARGATLEALQTRGITHAQYPDKTLRPARFNAVGSVAEAGPHRWIFMTTKADDLLKACATVSELLGPTSVAVSATNGIPPWYSYLQEQTIGRFQFPLSPRETFLAYIPPSQLVGAVVERSSKLAEPGVIERSGGKGFTVGELDHQLTERLVELQLLLEHAGLSVSLSSDIHRDIWLKLIGNVGVNPLSVLTEYSIGEMLAVPRLKERIRRLVLEAEAVGLRLGVISRGDFDLEQFFRFMSDELGQHRPSMYQDYVNGRPLETQRILDVVHMLAEAPGPRPIVAVNAVRETDRALAEKLTSSREPAEEQSGG